MCRFRSNTTEINEILRKDSTVKITHVNEPNEIPEPIQIFQTPQYSLNYPSETQRESPQYSNVSPAYYPGTPVIQDNNQSSPNYVPSPQPIIKTTTVIKSNSEKNNLDQEQTILNVEPEKSENEGEETKNTTESGEKKVSFNVLSQNVLKPVYSTPTCVLSSSFFFVF